MIRRHMVAVMAMLVMGLVTATQAEAAGGGAVGTARCDRGNRRTLSVAAGVRRKDAAGPCDDAEGVAASGAVGAVALCGA